jgi:hypothetical protein
VDKELLLACQLVIDLFGELKEAFDFFILTDPIGLLLELLDHGLCEFFADGDFGKVYSS